MKNNLCHLRYTVGKKKKTQSIVLVRENILLTKSDCVMEQCIVVLNNGTRRMYVLGTVIINICHERVW